MLSSGEVVISESFGEDPTDCDACNDSGEDVNMDPRERNVLAGVGIPRGTLECRTDERSSNVAAGVVNGRKCAW